MQREDDACFRFSWRRSRALLFFHFVEAGVFVRACVGCVKGCACSCSVWGPGAVPPGDFVGVLAAAMAEDSGPIESCCCCCNMFR